MEQLRIHMIEVSMSPRARRCLKASMAAMVKAGYRNIHQNSLDLKLSIVFNVK